MLFSKASTYGIRAVLYLTLNANKSFVSVREISEALGISYHFLGKIFQSLTQSGLVESYKGPHGGVKLARSPENLTVLDIYRVLDGMALFRNCVFGLDACSDKNPCPMHHKWLPVREKIYKILNQTNFAELARDTKAFNLRLRIESSGEDFKP